MNNKTKLPHGFRFLHSFQGIDEIHLDNGLKVLLFEDQSQGNVTVNITYLVGSRHEGRGEAGMAHLLEHMLFRGTKSLSDVKGALQDRGAHFNGTTWFDRTNYYETLTPSKENLDFALRLEADRMVNSVVRQEDLDAEMTVVRNEFEMGENNPVHVLHDQVMSAAYRWHNYGKTTIGNRSDIERVPASTLKKFYENYYQPDNAVLVVAGQFDRQHALDLIDRYFSGITRPERDLDPTYTEEPAQDGPREVILERVGDMASVNVSYHIPAATHRDHASLKILFDMIADEPGGIIYKELVETKRCSEVFSIAYALHDPGMAMIFVRPTDIASAMAIRDELVRIIEEDLEEQLTAEQVERIKRRLLKQIKISMSSSKEMALRLSEAIACGDWRLFFWYREQLKNVTLGDIKAARQRYLIKSNRTSGIFMPTPIPKRSVIEPALPAELLVGGLAEDVTLLPGEAFVATARAIEEMVVRIAHVPDQKLAILKKKKRGHSVRATLRFRFANADALLPYVKEFWLIPSLLLRGAKGLSHQALRDKIDALMSTIDIDGGLGILTAHVKSEREHLAEIFRLVAHVLREPSFSLHEFSLVKQREIDNLEEHRSDPQRLAFHELEKLRNPWPKGHILYVNGLDEMIDGIRSLNNDSVREAFYQHFVPQHLFGAVVGDCDGAAIGDLISELFGNKDAEIPYRRIPRPFIENVVDDVFLDTRDKEMAMVTQGFNFAMRDDHEDFASLKVANFMFGENMNSRLMNRIREREGISYGAGSSMDISRYEENAGVTIYAMAAPQSVSRAQRAIDEEWMRFVMDGPTDIELSQAKESLWLNFENSLGNDGFLVNAFASDLETDRDFLMREQLYQRIKQLSQNDVKAAVQKWWGDAKFARVTAADREKLL